ALTAPLQPASGLHPCAASWEVKWLAMLSRLPLNLKLTLERRFQRLPPVEPTPPPPRMATGRPVDGSSGNSSRGRNSSRGDAAPATCGDGRSQAAVMPAPAWRE